MVKPMYLIYDINTDLHDEAFAPRDVIIAIVVTTGSITVRLLGKTEQGTYTPLPGMVVHVYELADGITWSHIGNFATDEDGKITINRENTAEWYKAVFDGTDEYQPAIAYTWLLEAQPCSQPPAQQAAAPCASWLWLLLLLLALSENEIEVT